MRWHLEAEPVAMCHSGGEWKDALCQGVGILTQQIVLFYLFSHCYRLRHNSCSTCMTPTKTSIQTASNEWNTAPPGNQHDSKSPGGGPETKNMTTLNEVVLNW